MKRLFLLFLMLSCGGAFASAAVSAKSLGLYVTVLQEPVVICDRVGLMKLVDDAKATGVNDIFMQVYRANKAWFPSVSADATPFEACAKSLGEDPFAALIREAHRKDIRVHAWMNLLSLSKNRKAPMLVKYGTDILTRNVHAKSKLDDYRIDEQFFLEPGDANVRGVLIAVVNDVVSRYPGLDGIQFDYIRYPDKDPAYGYTRANVERFKKASGKTEISETDPAWRDWKRAQVTGLLDRLVKKARALHPGILVSTTGCAPYVRAYEEAFQEWPFWLNSKLVDFVTVMTYAKDPAQFARLVTDAKGRVKDPSRMGLAVGAYELVDDPAGYAQQMQTCREAGAGPCVIFHYGSLLQIKP